MKHWLKLPKKIDKLEVGKMQSVEIALFFDKTSVKITFLPESCFHEIFHWGYKHFYVKLTANFDFL